MHSDVLTRDEVRSALERRGCRRVPLMIRMWIGGDCYDAYGDRLRNFVETIPDDFIQVGFRAPGGWESSPSLFKRGSDRWYKGSDRHFPAPRRWDDLLPVKRNTH